MRLELDALKRFVADLAAAPDQWLPHVRHDRGARDYQQIWEDQDVNAWVICWSLDHDTGFHDHDQSAAGIAVVAGQVREERLRIGYPPKAACSDGAPRSSCRRARFTACGTRVRCRR